MQLKIIKYNKKNKQENNRNKSKNKSRTKNNTDNSEYNNDNFYFSYYKKDIENNPNFETPKMINHKLLNHIEIKKRSYNEMIEASNKIFW